MNEKQWTYHIDEKERRVYRIPPSGERCLSRSLGFSVFENDEMKDTRAIATTLDGGYVYLIARDELIDRGLIQDKGE